MSIMVDSREVFDESENLEFQRDYNEYFDKLERKEKMRESLRELRERGENALTPDCLGIGIPIDNSIVLDTEMVDSLGGAESIVWLGNKKRAYAPQSPHKRDSLPQNCDKLRAGVSNHPAGSKQRIADLMQFYDTNEQNEQSAFSGDFESDLVDMLMRGFNTLHNRHRYELTHNVAPEYQTPNSDD